MELQGEQQTNTGRYADLNEVHKMWEEQSLNREQMSKFHISKLLITACHFFSCQIRFFMDNIQLCWVWMETRKTMTVTCSLLKHNYFHNYCGKSHRALVFVAVSGKSVHIHVQCMQTKLFMSDIIYGQYSGCMLYPNTTWMISFKTAQLNELALYCIGQWPI